MLELTARDRALKGELKAAGVLQEIDGQRLPFANGVIMVTCADGDQMPDVFAYQLRLTSAGRPRVHTLALNGGALLLPRTKLVGETNEDRILLQHIAQAKDLKQIYTVALYVHAPCGVAYANGLDLEHIIQHLVDARARVLADMPTLDVLCFLHVDRGGVSGKKTYFVSPRLWRGRCEVQGIPAAASVSV